MKMFLTFAGRKGKKFAILYLLIYQKKMG